MTAREIVDQAVNGGLLTTEGKTPWKTMNARLSTDILNNKKASLFMRTGSGRFALRAWSDKISEFVSPRRVLALFDEDILVFDKNVLRDFIPTDGLRDDNIDYAKLLANTRSMRRIEAETRHDVIQLVSAYVVHYGDDILTYKRTRRLPENRLHNVYSLMFGGHLNPDDLLPLFSFNDPETALYMLIRELNEELIVGRPYPTIKFAGLLYDPRTEVSEQHVAIVFDVSMNNTSYSIGERGFLADAKFETRAQIASRISDFENWSEYLFHNLRLSR